MTTTKHILIDASGVKEVFNAKIPEHYNVLNSPVIIDYKRDNTAFIFEIIKTNAGVKFEFLHIENKIFANNLILIDSVFPKILSQYLLHNHLTGKNTIQELTELVTKENPVNFDYNYRQQYYEYKIKFFLTELVFGMGPSKVWKGEYRGPGFILYKSNDEIICFHAYDKNNFEEYLFHNTSIGTKNSVLEENEKTFLKINLQVRFK